MSIISNRHNVVAYTSGVTKPFDGQVLVTVAYKTGKDGVKKESKCASVPIIGGEDIVGNIEALVPHIQEMLAGVRKSILRELLDKEPEPVDVASNALSVAACIEYLEASDENGRLTKESVGVWFESAIGDSLAIALAGRLGISEVPTDEESKKVFDIIAAFKRDISALAGGKTSYNATIASQLKKALAYAPDGDVIASKFNARLDKMIASAGGNDLLDAL